MVGLGNLEKVEHWVWAPIKFTGEVIKKIKKATYKINIKRILKKEGAVVGLANGTLDADGKVIYVTENLKVGLFKS